MCCEGSTPCDDADVLYRVSLEIAGGNCDVAACDLRAELCKRHLHVRNNQVYQLVKRVKRDAEQLQSAVHAAELPSGVGEARGVVQDVL